MRDCKGHIVANKSTRPTLTAQRPSEMASRQYAPPAPNRLSVADITYASTWSGRVYIAFVIDAYARRILD